MNPNQSTTPKASAGQNSAKRTIEIKGDSLLCHRKYVSFEKLGVADEIVFGSGACIRVYGGFACATVQLRGFGPITPHGKPVQMIATAAHLDKRECAALIERLQEILPTLNS